MTRPTAIHALATAAGAVALLSVAVGAAPTDSGPTVASVAAPADADAAPGTEGDVEVEPTWRPKGLSPAAMAAARRAWSCATAAGEVESSVVTVIDFSLPSSAKRLWVLDVAAESVLFHELVSHGKNSGHDRTQHFSNVPGSKTSSLGVFRTAETYHGKHGRSLRLDGLDPGFNDKARERAIVIHGADYVSEGFVERHGRLGRSWGCPALRNGVAQDVIDTIAEDQLLVAYYPDSAWLDDSSWLSCEGTSG